MSEPNVEAVRLRQAPDRAGTSSPAARLVEAAGRRLLAGIEAGSLEMRLPSGERVRLGRTDCGPQAIATIHSARVLWSALARGSCGLAEGYMRGDWTSNDLSEIFRFACKARSAAHAGRRLFSVKLADRLLHRLRANTRAGSRRNIASHYDLGNDFYRLWLDEGLTYSSGDYRGGAATLEAAQDTKYERILELAALEPGHRVLEVGCGWGGLAERAASAGAHVVGLTLSREQLEHARRRIAAAGLGARCDLRLEDYRDVTGTYDAAISIEMIEAVGEARWPLYFEVLRDRLRPGGVAVLQAITIAEDRFEDYRRRTDFIQRYIFPGGMLPTRQLMVRHAEAAGLRLDSEETFSSSYARTLWAWRERFLANAAQVRALGFDDRFMRMWDYYLTYCAVGFEQGAIDVGIYRFRKA